MKIIVVGCGRLGSDLAVRLADQGNDVSIIDHVPGAFSNLPSTFEGRMIEGEAMNESVLHRAGIEKADVLAAVTNVDALNAVVAHLAHTVYNVPNVVVRNYDPHCRALHEAFGLQVVSSTQWGSQRMEELIYHAEVRAVFSAGNGEVEVYEFIIPPTWNGRKMQDFVLPGQTSLVSLTRAGKATLPSPETVLSAGDIINVSATTDGIRDLRHRLKVG
jgi:trk system potassium uptake protein